MEAISRAHKVNVVLSREFDEIAAKVADEARSAEHAGPDMDSEDRARRLASRAALLTRLEELAAEREKIGLEIEALTEEGKAFALHQPRDK